MRHILVAGILALASLVGMAGMASAACQGGASPVPSGYFSVCVLESEEYEYDWGYAYYYYAYNEPVRGWFYQGLGPAGADGGAATGQWEYIYHEPGWASYEGDGTYAYGHLGQGTALGYTGVYTGFDQYRYSGSDLWGTYGYESTYLYLGTWFYTVPTNWGYAELMVQQYDSGSGCNEQAGVYSYINGNWQYTPILSQPCTVVIPNLQDAGVVYPSL